MKLGPCFAFTRPYSVLLRLPLYAQFVYVLTLKKYLDFSCKTSQYTLSEAYTDTVSRLYLRCLLARLNSRNVLFESFFADYIRPLHERKNWLWHFWSACSQQTARNTTCRVCAPLKMMWSDVELAGAARQDIFSLFNREENDWSLCLAHFIIHCAGEEE